MKMNPTSPEVRVPQDLVTPYEPDQQPATWRLTDTDPNSGGPKQVLTVGAVTLTPGGSVKELST